jgi:hypothetical protein
MVHILSSLVIFFSFTWCVSLHVLTIAIVGAKTYLGVVMSAPLWKDAYGPPVQECLMHCHVNVIKCHSICYKVSFHGEVIAALALFASG